MRTIFFLITIACGYMLLRGWEGAPTLLMRSCLAVAVMVAGLAIWGIRVSKESTRMICLRKPTFLDYLSLGAVVLLTEVCFVAVTSALTEPAQHWVRSIGVDLTITSEGQAKAAGGTGEAKVVERPFDESMQRNVPPYSHRKATNQPEVFLKLNNSEGANYLSQGMTYVRSFVMSKVEGNKWAVDKKGEEIIRSPIRFASEGESIASFPVISYEVFQPAKKNVQNLFASIPGIVETDTERLIKAAEDVYFLPQLEDTSLGYNFRASSRLARFKQLPSSIVVHPDAEPTHFEIPASLSEKIRQQAQQFKQAGNLHAQLRAIKKHLQSNYEYSLEVRNRRGIGAMDNFLYGDKRGYCEHLPQRRLFTLVP